MNKWELTSSQGTQKPSEAACQDHLRRGVDPFAVMSEHSTTTGIRVYIASTPSFVTSITEIGDESELGSTGTCIGGRTGPRCMDLYGKMYVRVQMSVLTQAFTG